MATNQSTVEFIQDQLSSLKDISAKKMFGEYALYYQGKVVALICDDTLFVKMTDEGKQFIGEPYEEGCAYKGAKVSLKINAEQIENREWLSQLIQITAEHIQAPKRKTAKNDSPLKT
ncbi:TfoX/Sxy family protein [Patescibacteria group bacterium]|nr:TfoX/Sxy family protein [Patescibacteria group bacterium]MBP9709617.1 TfoX/Sxy family protein [Patescibacteria group bacterium]